jgi:hypothetical protein
MAFQAANGTQLGRHLVKNVGRKWRGGGCDGLPSLEISLESVESHAVPHSILPNHTEGHRLNGRDALSRKAGLRLGKDSAGVGVKNLLGQSSLKYCRRRGLNRCPLAWELGTLPLDQLDLLPLSDVQLQGKHCRKPHCRNGFGDTFGLFLLGF